MSRFLYNLGRFASRRRLAVLGVWLVILLTTGTLTATIGGELTDSFSLPGTESQDAFDLLEERFPAFAGSSATVVIAGEDLQGAQQQVTDLVSDLTAINGVTAVSPPFSPGTLSPDGSTMRLSVGFAVPAMAVGEDTFAAVEDVVDAARGGGLQIEVGGEVASAANREEPGGSTEVIGVAVAVLVLALTFGQVRAMGLTLANALIGVAISVTSVLIIASVVEIPSVAEILGIMIGLAVGIDYALFIVSRHRDQVRTGMAVEESIGRALATAGGAVVFAGSTVIIAMGGLLLVGIPFISLMAMSVVIAVILAVAVSTTLMPALLSFAGASIVKVTLPGPRGRVEVPPQEKAGARWSRAVTRRPWISFLAGLAVIGVLAFPLLSLQTGMPNDGTAPIDSSRRAAYELIARGFGPGFNAPLLVVVDHAALDAAAAQQAVAGTAAALRAQDGILLVAPPQTNPAGDTTIVQAVPTTGPADAATESLLYTLRDDALASVESETGAVTYVAGPTALNIDIDDKLLGRLPLLMGAVIGLTFLVLMVAFRSLLVPLKAAIGILLSIGAAMGIVVAVFQWGWGASLVGVDTTTPIISFLPVMSFAILFGLSMDYEVFILSRIREEWLRTGDAHDSVVNGVAVTARVITAAAAIMISVFSGFVLGDDTTVKMIGLGLASAVLIDATIVRMVLVPSTMVMFDKANWWLPGWLDRLIPNVDIEGEKLLEELEAEEEKRAVAAAGAPTEAGV